jgi:E3 ubiquitin-protein ligase RNF14
MHVKEGTVLKLTCPDTKCGGVVSPNILKTLLEEKEFERWEGLLLQITLDAMNDLVYCPRCETACLEDECNDAVCPSCLFSFCTLCTNHRHVGKECMTAEERIRMLEVGELYLTYIFLILDMVNYGAVSVLTYIH